VEKPLATTAADAERAVAAADGAGTILMVGHLLEYHPAVARLKELIDGDELGTLHYIYGNRLNLGKLRADENALWSLGAHDVSVVLHLIGEEPRAFRTWSSATCDSPPGSSPTCTSPGSTRTRSGG
jgi:predicted dehydrogenase